MSNVIISIEDLWKQYRLGVISHGTLTRDLQSWWARFRGHEDPNAPVGQRHSPGAEAQVSGDTFWALRGIDLQVREGEVLGIIGRNGAGKSTLLKVLSRVTAPSKGSVKIKGRLASLLEVGTGFHPELTGRENIYLNGTILGMRRQEVSKKLDAIVDFAEVETFIDTPVKRYSSGMYVRLAFAVAAHLETDILVVDEVLAVGDTKFQERCLNKMDELSGRGRTVLFVSHNMASVRRLCTRAALLHEGELLTQGDVPSVIEQYLQSGLSPSSERIWPDRETAPGSDVARLKAVRALDEAGNTVTAVNTRQDLFLEIEFWVLEEGAVVDAGFHLADDQSGLILMAGDFQNPELQGPRRAGVHVSRCRIPGDMLNNRKYMVHVWLCTNPHTLHARERDAIVLSVGDDMKPGGARGNYTAEWPATAVRPKFDWESWWKK